MKSLPLARALALIFPLAMLGGAYAFQFLGGLHPCEMCWWQRYAHFAAIPLALIAYALRGRACFSALFTGLAGLAIGISGGIGLFHAGVEYGWWQGLDRLLDQPDRRQSRGYPQPDHGDADHPMRCGGLEPVRHFDGGL